MLISEDIYNNKSSMMYCMASFNSSYLVLFADDYFYNYAGKLINIIITEMIHPNYVGEFKNVCESLKESGQSQRIITYIKGGDGQYFLVHMCLANNGNIINEEPVIDMNVVNIFMMEKKYTRLHNDVNKYRTYLSMYNDYMFDYDTVTDMFSLYIYRSFKATIICKMTLDKFEKVYMEYLNNARQKQDFTDFVNKVRNANEGFNGEITGPLITDMSKLVVYNIDCKLTYKNNRDRVVIGIIKSIDKQNEVSYYATQEGKDFFTGLLNKRACKEYVQDSIATNKDIHYMAMIDIDNFKNVNDTYGHLYGDKVILKVAAIINSALNGRGIVGRFGGDEFFIFTNWITKESQLRSILTFIKQKVRAELGQGENSCDVTLSMGVCKYPDNGSDYDSLFNKADKCLYIAKNKGKNRYIIYDAQKHGDFLDDMGRKGFSMAPIKKGETLAQEVADMSINLIKNGSSVLDNVLQRACKAFEIDGIRIYNGTTGRLIEYYGNYVKLPDINDIVNTKEFLGMFDKNHYMTIVYTSNIESFNKKLYDETIQSNIGGMIYSYFTNQAGDNIIASYDTFNKGFRWNESDKNYIMTLTKVIASVL